MEPVDAVVVGAGPNGLAAAITLARAGIGVEVFEGAPTVGGGTRTEELTLPGFCPRRVLGRPSRLSCRLPSSARWISRHSASVCASPSWPSPTPSMAAGPPRSTATSTRRPHTWAATPRTTPELVGPLVQWLDRIVPYVLSPMRSIPSDPLALARFAWDGSPSVRHVAKSFSTDSARALLAGTAAHSMEPLTAPLTAAFALLLTALGHGAGWPVVQGGSAAITRGLAAELRHLGGTVHTDHPISALDELPPARAVLLDTSPRQFLQLARGRLSRRAGRPWARFKPGAGTCKIDWALSGPVPWAAESCRRTVTVHVGGTFEEVARSEADVRAGRHSERPFVLVAQPCVVDPSRAPEGRHTLWAYCHVPNGSAVDMTQPMEDQIERFAPGFRDLVLARVVRRADQAEAYDPNLLGGDVNGGAQTLRQTAFRPVVRWNPYRTPVEGVYLCSASTPPGGGVHGMCGVAAADVVLRERFRAARRSG